MEGEVTPKLCGCLLFDDAYHFGNNIFDNDNDFEQNVDKRNESEGGAALDLCHDGDKTLCEGLDYTRDLKTVNETLDRGYVVGADKLAVEVIPSDDERGSLIAVETCAISSASCNAGADSVARGTA